MCNYLCAPPIQAIGGAERDKGKEDSSLCGSTPGTLRRNGQFITRPDTVSKLQDGHRGTFRVKERLSSKKTKLFIDQDIQREIVRWMD